MDLRAGCRTAGAHRHRRVRDLFAVDSAPAAVLPSVMDSPKHPSRIEDLRAHVAQLERELEGELQAARERWRYRIDAGRVRFERDARLAHQRLKQRLPRFIRESSLLNALTTPVIFSLIVPIALLDLWVSVYQRVCFPIYGIARVPRSAYIVIDRQQLAYLNGIEKANCVFCGYANGVFAYVREIAGRTEQYWCPIRHAKRPRGTHAHYREFVDFGDAAGYRQRLPLLRAELKPKRRD
jgi:hypothetical protein